MDSEDQGASIRDLIIRLVIMGAIMAHILKVIYFRLGTSTSVRVILVS